jgi:predicted membrane protein
MNSSTVIRLILAILLLFCLADMPYGYYELVRFLALAAFGYLAFEARNKNQNIVIVYILLALLFQPFFKLSLGRTIWNVVDVIVGVGLIYSVFSDTNKKRLSKIQKNKPS